MVTWSEGISAVSAVAAAVAAVAAVRAIHYARKTAEVSNEALNTAKQAAADAHEAHLQEISQREEAIAAEREVELWRRFIRVVESVSGIAEAMAGAEQGNRRDLRLVTLRQAELKAALRALRVVGGPELPECTKLESAPTDSVDYAELALGELDGAGQLLSKAEH